MDISEAEIRGIGVALNEATLLGAEVDPKRALAGLTFSVLSLPPQGEPLTDRRVQILLSPVRRVAAALLRDLSRGVRASEDVSAVVESFQIHQLLDVVQSFGGCPIYGWNFVDVEAEWEATWESRLSLDWRNPDPAPSAHTLTIFQDGIDRFLELRFWFDDLALKDADQCPLSLGDFIAGGRRWWDGLYANDPRTSGAGIYPLKPSSKE